MNHDKEKLKLIRTSIKLFKYRGEGKFLAKNLGDIGKLKISFRKYKTR
jgi:hypothetical protein